MTTSTQFADLACLKSEASIGVDINSLTVSNSLTFPSTALPCAAASQKYGGTVIPNRIFVGGLPSTTTEEDLKTFFNTYGQVKDAKIINDRSGLSKGVYGFVTFESQEVAEKIIKNESESLVFKDRKLNIGPAVRKPQFFPRQDLPGTLLLTNGSVPYPIQNGMTMFPVAAAQDYSILTQPASYTPMVFPQPMYFPQYAYQNPTLTALSASAPGPPNNTTINGNPLNGLSQTLDQWSSGLSNAATGMSSTVLPSHLVNAAPNGFQNNTSANQQAWRWTTASTPQTTSQPQNAPNVSGAQGPFLYGSYQNNGPDLIYIQPAGGAFTPSSTSDYSTDTSASMYENNEHDSPPRINLQDSFGHFNSTMKLSQINSNGQNSFSPTTNLNPSMGCHQNFMTNYNPSLKSGLTSAYALPRVVPARPILSHFNRNDPELDIDLDKATIEMSSGHGH